MFPFKQKIFIATHLVMLAFSSGAASANICDGIEISPLEFAGANKMAKIEETTSSETLEEVLNFQKQFIAKRSKKDTSGGFLISAFDPTEFKALIAGGARLLTARMHGELAGYALITPLNEFTHLYQDPAVGSLVLADPLSMEQADFNYLYQIAVSTKFAKAGIGTALLRRAAEVSPKGLLTDILIEPLNNEASISFFTKNHYRKIGTLILNEYRDFGRLKSEVLLWKPSHLRTR